MVKIAVIILVVLILLDVVFQLLRRKRKNLKSKEKMDSYLLNKYSRNFHCVSFSSRDGIYEDGNTNFSVNILSSGKVVDNLAVSRISAVLGKQLDIIDIECPCVSSCRVSSFENFESLSDFSLESILSCQDRFLVNVLTVVSLSESEFYKIDEITDKIDSQLKAFPVSSFTRNIIFVNRANFAEAKKFAVTYLLGSGDLSEYTGHVIRLDTKSFGKI